MGSRGTWSACGAIALAMLGPRVAQAQPYDAEQASIDFADSKYDVACKYFVEAERIAPSDDFQAVKHAIDQFACYVRAGLGERADRARALLDAYYAGKPEPEPGKAPAHYKARFKQYVAVLEKNGPRLSVELPDGAKADAITVSRDGVPVQGEFTKAQFVDAGSFHVVARSGADTFEAVALVDNPLADGKLERETAAIVVRPTKKAPTSTTDPKTVPPDPNPHDPKGPVAPAKPQGSAAPGVALLVSGGLVAVVGGVLLGVAGAKAGEIPDSCDPDTLACANDADTQTANDASSVGVPLLGAGAASLAVGGGLAIVGAVLLATRSSGDAKTESAFVAPWIDARTIGIFAAGSW